MPRWRDWDEDDPGMDYHTDDEESPYDDDDEPTIPCPYCRREILEEAERCPYCEHYISKEDAPPQRKPLWIVVGVIACLYVVYRWNVWW
jgi:hypothetical protein